MQLAWLIPVSLLELCKLTFISILGPYKRQMCGFKDLYSTAPKRGSVFIGLMAPDGAIWSRYQRTFLMR